jgi:hypothetical protein
MLIRVVRVIMIICGFRMRDTRVTRVIGSGFRVVM